VLLLVSVRSGGRDGGRFVGGSSTDGIVDLALNFINDAAGDAVVVNTVGGAVSREDIFECPEQKSATGID
jgi:succinyl-CoA synthetase beta subunit